MALGWLGLLRSREDRYQYRYNIVFLEKFRGKLYSSSFSVSELRYGGLFYPKVFKAALRVLEEYTIIVRVPRRKAKRMAKRYAEVLGIDFMRHRFDLYHIVSAELIGCDIATWDKRMIRRINRLRTMGHISIYACTPRRIVDRGGC